MRDQDQTEELIAAVNDVIHDRKRSERLIAVVNSILHDPKRSKREMVAAGRGLAHRVPQPSHKTGKITRAAARRAVRKKGALKDV